MRKITIILFMAMIIAGSFTIFLPINTCVALGSIITVDDSGGADYTTIQAAINAANESNAMNLLNLSNYALSSLWQQWRDEASWVNTASENEVNRNHNLAIAALERTTTFDLQNSAQKSALYAMLGAFGMKIFSNLP